MKKRNKTIVCRTPTTGCTHRYFAISSIYAAGGINTAIYCSDNSCLALECVQNAEGISLFSGQWNIITAKEI